MKCVFAAATVLALAGITGVSRAQCDSDPWRLVWSDEFDGTAVNNNNWRIRFQAGQHNNEQQYYLPEMVSVANGRLTLTSTNIGYGGRPYRSGLVDTRGKFQTRYGKVVVRAKLPKTQGIWPAIWLLPTTGLWPPEIDIMELLGHEPTRVYMSNHWGPVGAVATQTTDFAGPDFSADFHEFSCEWFPDRIDFFVDGVRRASHRAGVPQEPMYLIINTAVGGFWPGYPDATTVFPQRFEVDWVRAYEYDPAAIEQLLANPGFESGAAASLNGWATFGNAYPDSLRSWSGPGALKIFGNFSGGQNASGAYQDFPASPGETWRATARTMHRADDAIQSTSFAVANIEWRNASGGLISFESVRAIDGSAPTEQWRDVTVTGVAPPGTARARVVLLFLQQNNAPGAVYFDDVTFGREICDQCPADWDGSGGVDGDDITAFFVDWQAGSADIVESGGTDGDDIAFFFARWQTGC